MPAGELTPYERRHQAEVRKQIASFKQFEASELANHFEFEDIEKVDEYQRGSDPSELVSRPVPSEFTDKYGESAFVLQNNTTTYDDETEDLLVTDSVMQSLMDVKRRDRTNINVTAAIRARRSVLISLWSKHS